MQMRTRPCSRLPPAVNSWKSIFSAPLFPSLGGLSGPTHLTEDQQPLLFFLIGGQGGELLQLQRRGWCGDVQVVLEGLEDGAGWEARFILPITDDTWGDTEGMRLLSLCPQSSLQVRKRKQRGYRICLRSLSFPARVRVCVSECMRVCMCVCTCMYSCTCVYVCVLMYVHACVCVHVYMYMCVHACVM